MKNIDAVWTDLFPAQPSSFVHWPDYSDPKEILFSSELSIEKKREILSSWASDARVVSGQPAQRRLDNGATVSIHDILNALKQLDAPSTVRPPEQKEFTTYLPRSSSRKWLPATLRSRRRDDDDDDPPPCPAVISPFPHLPLFGAESELEAA